MRKSWCPVIAGGKKIAVRFEVRTDVLNTVKVYVSIPCRKGQYVVLYGVDNSKFKFEYYNGKCIVSWNQNTSDVYSFGDLLTDIRIWFRYSYAIRLDEGIFTTYELLRVL